MAAEYTDVVAAYLTERLKNDSTMTGLINGRVYDSRLPQAKDETERAALYPCVLFNLQASLPALKGNGDTIVWVPGEYQVVGMDEYFRGFTSLVPISARIQQLLHGFKGTVTGGGYINSSDWLRPIKIAEERFNRLGGLVRIRSRLLA